MSMNHSDHFKVGAITLYLSTLPCSHSVEVYARPCICAVSCRIWILLCINDHHTCLMCWVQEKPVSLQLAQKCCIVTFYSMPFLGCNFATFNEIRMKNRRNVLFNALKIMWHEQKLWQFKVSAGMLYLRFSMLGL